MIAERRELVRRRRGAIWRLTVIGLCTGAPLTLWVSSALALSATDRAAAQALFDRAKKLMSEGNFTEACPALEESERIEARSGTLLNLADCYEHVGRLASAWSSFIDAAAMAAATSNKDREQGARERAAALAPHFSKLVIVLPPSANIEGIEVTRDGDPVGAPQLGIALPADSGSHFVAAKAPGRQPWQTIVVVEGGATTATVTVPELKRILDETAADVPVAAAPTTVTPEEQAATRASTAAQTLGIRLPRGDQPAAHETMDSHPGREDQPDAAPDHSNAGVIAGAVATGLLAAGTVVTSLVYTSKLNEYNAANAAHADNRSVLHSQAQAFGIANLALLGGTVVAGTVTVILWARAPSAAHSESARLELGSVVSPGLTGLTLGFRQ